VLDRDGRVEYASPNAVSALHRIGVHANAEGMRLSELGLEDVAVRTSFAIGAPVTRRSSGAPRSRCSCGACRCSTRERSRAPSCSCRDISELRRRDRLLISMDATIREIHHRVKNNLQTISSLLRLQGRRLESPEAKGAIEESVRRSGPSPSSRDPVARGRRRRPVQRDRPPLVRMVEEGLLSPEHPITIEVEGDAGKLPARIATPLAVVLNELLQNTVDHAFPRPGRPTGARSSVTLSNDGAQLVLRVVDDGVGLPEGFSIDQSRGLGLSIVRSLVTSQIEGSIVMRGRSDGSGPTAGTEIEITVPLIGGPG
jgi:two-component sensor histidine kinase